MGRKGGGRSGSTLYCRTAFFRIFPVLWARPYRALQARFFFWRRGGRGEGRIAAAAVGPAAAVIAFGGREGRARGVWQALGTVGRVAWQTQGTVGRGDWQTQGTVGRGDWQALGTVGRGCLEDTGQGVPGRHWAGVPGRHGAQWAGVPDRHWHSGQNGHSRQGCLADEGQMCFPSIQ